MKNKLIKFSAVFSILMIGLLCSINKAHAYSEPNAIENTEEQASNETVNDNYFKGFLYDLEGYPNNYHIEAGKTYSNIIPLVNNVGEEESSLYISALYCGVNDVENFDFEMEIVFFDSKFWVMDNPATMFGDCEKNITKTENGVRFDIKIDGLVRESAEYLMICLEGFINGDFIDKNNIYSMCVKYVPVSQSLDTITPNYEINSNVQWFNNSGKTGPVYQYDVAFDTSISDIVKDFRAIENDENLNISSYSFKPEEQKLEDKTYSYILKVKSNNGIEDFVVVNLTVVDTVAPVIYGTDTLNVSASNPMSINAIKNSLYAIDNKDGSVEIFVKKDNYTKNASVPGTYLVEFYAKDKAGNRTEKKVLVTVKDTNAPVFYNEYGQVIDKMTVFKSIDSVFSYKDVLGLISAIDDSDGYVEILNHKDDYTGNGDSVGNYTILLKAVDSSENTSYFTIDIVVIDDMPSKTIVLDKRVVMVENNMKLTTNDFAKIMRYCNFYGNNTTSYIDIQLNNYGDYGDVPGDYIVSYEINSSNGDYLEGSFNVKVLESRGSDTIVNEKIEEQQEEKEFFIIRIFKWLWKLIKSIFSWIVGVFK